MKSRVCDGRAQDGAHERLVVANDRQADNFQAALRGIKDLAAPHGHKSVAEGHRRCQIRKRHRGHRSASKPRRYVPPRIRSDVDPQRAGAVAAWWVAAGDAERIAKLARTFLAKMPASLAIENAARKLGVGLTGHATAMARV
jgi:hypothetical protein